MQLSKHFTFEELTNTSHQNLLVVNIQRAETYVKVLEDLCNYVLEPLRALVGKPIIVTSGFRSKELNDKVKGSKTSQHCFGEAVDIIVKGISADTLFSLIYTNKNMFNNKIGQCIIEKVNSSEWVHISIKTERYANVLKERYGNDNTVFLSTTDGKKYTKV